ncbi:MAG: hypothetical protein KDD22_08830 [Bdellovibrionales bacterium]|nr:hypothetical protein [Bdellovibrionales bacterium]
MSPFMTTNNSYVAQSFLDKAANLYPEFKNCPQPPNANYLLSEIEVEVSKAQLEIIEHFIQCIFRVSRQAEYRHSLAKIDDPICQFFPPNDSVLMAYDFHIANDGTPKLIEVNTNASGFLVADTLYKTLQRDPYFREPLKALAQSFQTEAGASTSLESVIIDENLLQQKMLFEFYMYKSFLESLGWRCKISDFRELSSKADGLYIGETKLDFIYNRLTDFYLQKKESHPLRRAYITNQARLSPQPREYYLLADKQRMVDWSMDGFWGDAGATKEEIDLFDRILLKSYNTESFKDLDQLWTLRKKMFFKPLRMYGGKSVFKGANISRKRFLEMLDAGPCLAQELCSPALVQDKGGTTWKYDLRFYVYRDQVQLGVARLYQGQLTNFKTPGGGYATLRVN